MLLVKPEYQSNIPNSAYGLNCLGAYLEKGGIRVKTLVHSTSGLMPIVRKEIQKGVRFIGFSATADNLSHCINAIRLVKKSGVVTILGGPQVCALGESELQKIGCDYMIEGEGEIPLLALMRYLKHEEGDPCQIAGLRFIDKSGVYHANAVGNPLENLEDIGTIDNRFLLQPLSLPHILFVMTGRGCPFACTFCHESHHAKKVRLRSIENVMREIDHNLEQNPKISCVAVLDDTFTLNPQRVYEFCREMKKRKLVFACEGHVRTLYNEPAMIDALADAGLQEMQIGIESGSEAVLRAYQKQTTPEMILEVVKRCKQAKVPFVNGNFIIGGAFENESTLQESRELAVKLMDAGAPMLMVHTAFFAAYPETAITKNPQKFEMCIDEARCENTLHSMKICVNSTRSMSRARIQEAKHEFDALICEQMHKKALSFTRQDMEFLQLQSRQIGISGTPWHSFLLAEYCELFLFYLRGYQYNNIFNKDAVIFRTFEDLQEDENTDLMYLGYRFSGKDKLFLQYANGNNTFATMAEKLAVSLDEIYAIYAKLHGLCAVYMAEI